ncbi:unnamed protein product [Spirodela intermedia]|uniref:Uncharacterized protein n=1 Tax=Spirodela intermedia TaxID=51605 RepID=A0A7I8JQI4_SPIIN|nr:unnamed protein product [Spirodela intermedia]CAA6672396.1 unnamed protein product [Spirodela intermedia]
MADLIAAGLQSGWRVFNSELNGTVRVSKGSLDGPAASVKAARMLTPGAVISGCPRDEKYAMKGAGFVPKAQVSCKETA